MACCNVRNFVRHHASQFRLAIGIENQSGVNVKKPAWQRKRIHIVGINDLECKRNASVRVSDKFLSQLIDVLRHHGICDYFGRRFDFGGIVFAHLNLLLQAVPVSKAAFATDIAVTDGVNVANAAMMKFRYAWNIEMWVIYRSRTHPLSQCAKPAYYLKNACGNYF